MSLLYIKLTMVAPDKDKVWTPDIGKVWTPEQGREYTQNQAVEVVNQAGEETTTTEENRLYTIRLAKAVAVLAKAERDQVTEKSEEKLVDTIIIANQIEIKNCRLNLKRVGRKCSKKPLIHLWYIFNASVIAAIGLSTNSGPVVVASMLVSSMVEPIKGMSTSLRYICGSEHKYSSIQKRRFWCHFMTLIIDIMICILVGMIVGAVMARPSWPSSPYSIMEELSGLDYGKNETNANIRTPAEISGRAKPIGLLISSVIALTSAFALVTADKQGNKSALVGIGISASLLPPAVNAGILWSFEYANKNCINFDIFERGFVNCDYTFAYQGSISLALTFVNVAVILVVWTVGLYCRLPPVESIEYFQMFSNKMLTTNEEQQPLLQF